VNEATAIERRQNFPQAEVDEVTLDGRKVRVTNVELDIDEVTLDPSNPRIVNTLALSLDDGQEVQKRLEAILWEDPDVRDLYRQVLINKGLIERIIVRRDGRVVEGNCRTVVYRKLRQSKPNDKAWQTIPARLLPEDIADREVAILLGEMHVAGKNTWSAFEKAGHIYRLHRDFALTQEEIAHRFRMSKSKVNQLVKSFELMRSKFLQNYPSASNIRKFSYFEEAYKNPKLREWITSDPAAEDQFVAWVGDGKLPLGTSVRELVAIVANSDAFQAMNESGFAAAKRVLEADDPAVTSRLFRRMKEMTEELEQARLDDIQRVRTDHNPAAKKIAKDLERALRHFLELCDVDRH